MNAKYHEKIRIGQKVILKKLILRLLNNSKKTITFELPNRFSNFKKIRSRHKKLHLVNIQSKLFEIKFF